MANEDIDTRSDIYKNSNAGQARSIHSSTMWSIIVMGSDCEAH
jgi:hypothetical protein